MYKMYVLLLASVFLFACTYADNSLSLSGSYMVYLDGDTAKACFMPREGDMALLPESVAGTDPWFCFSNYEEFISITGVEEPDVDCTRVGDATVKVAPFDEGDTETEFMDLVEINASGVCVGDGEIF